MPNDWSMLQMLNDKDAVIGYSGGRNNPKNAYVNKFMEEVREIARPVNLDYPRDAELADNGKRMENINKASRVCTAMITSAGC